jgi:malate dehydrogenase (oxaloacetate-decarboxylating)(NADP+)
VFDLEIQAESPEAFIDTLARIAPSFGGINLEDIAAPACFQIEEALIERLDIPVFHDDQHGTAIILGAALLNALELQGKSLQQSRIVCLGAGAAAIASMQLLLALGAMRSNILMVDRRGVVHSGRQDLNAYKQTFASETGARTLEDALSGADVFVGLSGPNLLAPPALATMASRPVVFALSNPDPEISPNAAHSARDDLIMATGRSDYPNQVNNVLGFPYIFRGALNVRARRISLEMKLAALQALKALVREPVPEEVLRAYRLDHLEFGPNYIIPKPFDPRLLSRVAGAVEEAAVRSGVARLPVRL